MLGFSADAFIGLTPFGLNGIDGRWDYLGLRQTSASGGARRGVKGGALGQRCHDRRAGQEADDATYQGHWGRLRAGMWESLAPCKAHHTRGRLEPP